MKRWIHAQTDLITKEDIKKSIEKDWDLSIDTPSIAAYVNDDYAFWVFYLDKAADFLNSAEGNKYIEEIGDLKSALVEAYYNHIDCGAEKYTTPDSFDRGDAFEIANIYKKAGLEVPEWLYG